MKFEPIPAHELLRPFVRNYWHLTCECTAPGTQRILSNGAMSLHFYLSQDVKLDDDDRFYKTSLNRHDLNVMGVQSRPGFFNIFGVEFVPFGTRAFWNIKDLTSSHITPQDLDDEEFILLEKNIHNAATNDERRQWTLSSSSASTRR